MTNIGTSSHHGSNQSMIVIRNRTKPCKGWESVWMLLRAMNGNQIMTNQVKSATTTLSPRGNDMGESALIHWNLSWVVYIVISLASYSNFVQVMASWGSISGREASMSEIIIANVVSWKQLSTSSRSVLCILQNETCWGKFPRSFILGSFLIPRRVLAR